jgi:hypothetical protein
MILLLACLTACSDHYQNQCWPWQAGGTPRANSGVWEADGTTLDLVLGWSLLPTLPATYYQKVVLCGAPATGNDGPSPCYDTLKPHLKSLAADATGVAITLTDMRELVKAGSLRFLITIPDAMWFTDCLHDGPPDHYWYDVTVTFDAQGGFLRLDATTH